MNGAGEHGGSGGDGGGSNGTSRRGRDGEAVNVHVGTNLPACLIRIPQQVYQTVELLQHTHTHTHVLIKAAIIQSFAHHLNNSRVTVHKCIIAISYNSPQVH